MVRKPTTQRTYALLRQLKKKIGEEDVSILDKLNIDFQRHSEPNYLIGSKDFPLWLSRLQTWLVSMRVRVQSLASFSRLKIRCCHELWYRSQTCLRSFVAVAVVQAGSCSSDSTPSLGTSICCRNGPKKKKKKRKQIEVITFGSGG